MSKGIWIVYNKETTAIHEVRGRNGRVTDQYYGIGAARAAVTRLQRQWMKQQGVLVSNAGPQADLAIAERDHYYAHIERQVRRVNMMTGAEYWESVNTSRHCSPSSEAYWSM
jgi:3'-phosphoadenosine 5'-phosphosulfate sulfotransferase